MYTLPSIATARVLWVADAQHALDIVDLRFRDLFLLAACLYIERLGFSHLDPMSVAFKRASLLPVLLHTRYGDVKSPL